VIFLLIYFRFGSHIVEDFEVPFGSGYESCPEFGVLGGVIFKFDIL
jgi:hypothetical protein